MSEFNEWDNFIESFSAEECMQIYTDYLVFEKQGSIGDCLLRQKAQFWMDQVSRNLSVVMLMRDIAFEVMKIFAKGYVKVLTSATEPALI